MPVEFLGPFGGDGGNHWDDRSQYTGVRAIHLTHKGAVGKFNIIYDSNGQDREIEHPSGDHTYTEENPNFGFPDGRITNVSGYTGSAPGTTTHVVRSITITTNENIFGPFGVEEGAPFNVQIPAGAHISGFRGRSSDNYLNAIGIYVTKP